MLRAFVRDPPDIHWGSDALELRGSVSVRGGSTMARDPSPSVWKSGAHILCRVTTVILCGGLYAGAQATAELSQPPNTTKTENSSQAATPVRVQTGCCAKTAKGAWKLLA